MKNAVLLFFVVVGTVRANLYAGSRELYESSSTPFNLDRIAISNLTEKPQLYDCLVENEGVKIKMPSVLSVKISMRNHKSIMTLSESALSDFLRNGGEFINGELKLDNSKVVSFEPICKDQTTTHDLYQNAKAQVSTDNKSFDVTMNCRNGKVATQTSYKKTETGIAIRASTASETMGYATCKLKK